MATVVWSSLLAVVGTLSGALLAGWAQASVARTARHETRRDTHRADGLAAITALVSALDDHRRAMWVREDHQLAGADAQVIAAARSASHATRSAITTPLLTVRILLPTLADLAQDATTATYALRDAPDATTLAALRTSALRASDRLTYAAAHLFTPATT